MEILQCIVCFDIDCGKGFGISVALPGDMDFAFKVPLVYLPEENKTLCPSCKMKNNNTSSAE